MPSAQARYWLLTIPYRSWRVPPALPHGLQYLRGQQEIGATGYHHWQLLAVFSRAVRLAAVKDVFGNAAHAEPSRSAAADEYVWKEDTRVADTQFELGARPHKNNSKTDWALVRRCAVSGDFDAIPDGVFVRNFRSIVAIHQAAQVPLAQERTCAVFWGNTGTGKSRRAWAEAGMDAYVKDPRTKWWDGYSGQEHVVIDEFRGVIDVAHLLRWLDRYPVRVEVKGGSVALRATKFWITSNLSPDAWYPDLDRFTQAALRRRLTVTHFERVWTPAPAPPELSLEELFGM